MTDTLIDFTEWNLIDTAITKCNYSAIVAYPSILGGSIVGEAFYKSLDNHRYEKGWWIFNEDGARKIRPTHWLPLPDFNPTSRLETGENK